MKLLLFSDLHSDLVAARRLISRAQMADVVVAAGDFCNAHHDLSACIDVLRLIDRPTVLVAGNNETPDELRQACKNWKQAHVLHGSAATIAGIPFFGIGGGVPITPFGSWSFDLSEEQASRLLASCPANGVLVSHSPPKGAVDVSSLGQSLGSVAVRAAVDQLAPLLVVCGHIHGSSGQHTYLGRTPVVNAGPDGVEWELRG